jgi:hypothetical protein
MNIANNILLQKPRPMIALATPTTGVGEDAGKKEPSYTVGWSVN